MTGTWHTTIIIFGHRSTKIMRSDAKNTSLCHIPVHMQTHTHTTYIYLRTIKVEGHFLSLMHLSFFGLTAPIIYKFLECSCLLVILFYINNIILARLFLQTTNTSIFISILPTNNFFFVPEIRWMQQNGLLEVQHILLLAV